MNTQKIPLKRLASEEKFHDSYADSINVEELLVDENFEAVTAQENKFVLKEFGELSGKTLLDLGCGAGESSVYFAKKGAKVTAVDISNNMLRCAKELANRHGVKIETLKTDAGNIFSMGREFDYIYGNGILHHIDFKDSITDIKKALSYSGKAIFIEPLAHNCIIDVYRKLAKDVRSSQEAPLKLKDIEFFKKHFKKVKHKEFWFFSLLIFIFLFFRGIHPSKVRYWKYIIKHAGEYQRLFSVLNLMDRGILRVFPFLRRFCWNTVISLEEPYYAK